MKYNLNPRLMSWVILFIIFNNVIQAQNKSNFEILKTLIDSSVSEIVKNGNADVNISLKINLAESFKILENYIYNSFLGHGKNVTPSEVFNSNFSLTYTLENSSVKYGECFRDGFLGDHLVPREISLIGSYSVQQVPIKVKNFEFVSRDTVKYDDIELLENRNYPFTKGDIPPEPLFSSLFEPFIAIAAAATVITLFFTVRSK